MQCVVFNLEYKFCAIREELSNCFKLYFKKTCTYQWACFLIQTFSPGSIYLYTKRCYLDKQEWLWKSTPTFPNIKQLNCHRVACRNRGTYMAASHYGVAWAGWPRLTSSTSHCCPPFPADTLISVTMLAAAVAPADSLDTEKLRNLPDGDNFFSQG